MWGSKSQYDRGVNTFSPEGRLLQVEYALESIKLGSSAIGLVTKGGVVLAAERRIQSKLQVPQSIEKIYELDDHIACTSSGLNSDAKTLVDIARVETQNHRFIYNEGIRVKALTQCISDQMLNFGEGDPSNKQKPMARPYGVSMIVAGYDETGPIIYHTDPSGTMIEFQAKGTGAADEGLQSLLLEHYKKDLSLEEGEKLALSCLKQVMEEKINKDNIELCVIPETTKKYTQRNTDHIENIIKQLD